MSKPEKAGMGGVEAILWTACCCQKHMQYQHQQQQEQQQQLKNLVIIYLKSFLSWISSGVREVVQKS
jgi:hypothetical protein